MDDINFMPPSDLISPAEMAQQLLQTRDAEQFSMIVSQLNAELKKKEYARLATFSDIQDELAQQLLKRITKNSDSMSNKDLVTYLTAIQNILDRSAQAAANTPAIAIQHNVVNVGVGDDVQKMSKESRDKIKDAVDYILSQQLSQIDKTNMTQEIIDSDDE